MEISARVRSQREKGAWRLLSVPGIYDAFQTAIGARGSRQRLVDEFIRARPDDRVLEVGCGTARMLDHFSVAYLVIIDDDFVGLRQLRIADTATAANSSSQT